jgi:hypothetical protein
MSRIDGYPPGFIVDNIMADIAFEKKLDNLTAMRHSYPLKMPPRPNDVGYNLYQDQQAERLVKKARRHGR